MGTGKTLGTNFEAYPSAVLALPVNNTVDMRIRKRLKAEDEKKESPTCEVNDDKGQRAKLVAELCSWVGKKKRKPRKRCTNGMKHETGRAILINDSLLLGNSSASLTDGNKSRSNSVIAPSNKQNSMQSVKEAVQSEMKADISPDLEARCDSPGLTSNICSSIQSDGRPLYKVDNSFMEKCDKDDGKRSTNFSSKIKIVRVGEASGIKTYVRRKKGVYDSSKIDSNSIQEDICSLKHTVRRTGNTSSGYSGETLSGGCSKDVDKILVEGEGSQFRVLEDVQVDKLFDGSADLECAVGGNEGRMNLNNSMEKITEGCFNMDKPLVDNVEEISELSKSENLNDVAKAGEPGISPEDKTFDDECGKITSEEPVGCSSIMRVSESSNSRDDTSQINKDLNLSPGRSLTASSRKKLLVLDLNGLIAEIIRYVPERHTPDGVISRKAVFKRPFYEDFLQFCFSRFSVGVWSSRAKSNMQSIVDFLLGDAKHNLLFCWDQSQCTESGFFTVENRKKPLYVKKLQKLWEKYEPDLPWKLGEYNEANTLMLDDSPYKALLNPPHTAIFPPSYRHTNKDDDSLGPAGALRIYLEGLANAEDVQKYVKENPFGQRPITEKNASWRFYQMVIEAILRSPGNTHGRGSANEPEWGHGIQSGKGDMNSTFKTLDECPESHEQRASGSPNRHMLCGTDRPHWRRGAERRGGDWNSDYKHRRSSDYHDRSRFDDASRQDWGHGIQSDRGRGIQSGKGDLNSAGKTLDECPESHEQRDCDTPNRHILCSTDRPHWRRGAERRGDWNSDYNPRRSSDYHDRCRFDDASRQDYGSRIQRRGGDWNRAYRDQDKCPVSDWSKGSIQGGHSDWNRACRDQDKSPVSDDPKDCGNLSFDTKGSDWSRGIQGGHGDRNRASRDQDKHLVSYDQKGSRYSSGYSSFGTQRSDRSWGIHRGGGDWNRTYQPLDQRPVSFNQRVSGYSCNNRYPRTSFHWQAYR